MKKLLNMLFPSNEKGEVVLPSAFQEKKERRSDFDPQELKKNSKPGLQAQFKGKNPFDSPSSTQSTTSIQAPSGLVGTGIQSKRSR